MREETRVAAIERREARRTWLVVAALAGIFLLALFVRSYWNVDVAQNDGNFLLSGGSDPYYHKHAVDHILGLDTGSEPRWQHLLFDPMLNYPYGMVNPNPPLYEWSIAVSAAVLDPVLPGDLGEAAWWATEWSSVVLGAAIVFPLYFLGAELFDRRTGIIAAFLWAVSTSAIGNTSIGFADHDAMALLFIVLGFLFYIKSVKSVQGERIWVQDWRSGASISGGLRALFRERSYVFAMATLAGISFGGVALVWKGFPYALGIVFAFALLSFVVDHWRNRDSTGLFLATTLSFVVALLIAAPYYYNPSVGVQAFFSPILYILVALVVAGIVMVPTRDLPTILVIPAFIMAVTVLAVIAFFVGGGTIAKTLLFTLVYFQGTPLYRTIAEAQPADFNSVVFSVGPVVFLLAIVALGALLWRSRKEARRDRVFALVWAVVAIYMAFSAARFLFNAVPVFVLLGAWIVSAFIGWLDFGSITKSMAGSQGSRFSTFRRSLGAWQIIGAVLIAALLVVPNVWLAVDAGMPRQVEEEYAGESCVQNPEQFFCERFGAYGQDYVGSQWVNGFGYLAGINDYATPGDPASRPGFLSWWDYGHWAIALGDHPAVADNFQNGYAVAGNWLLAANETEALQVLAGQHTRLYEEGAESRLTGQELSEQMYLANLQRVGVANPQEVFDALKVARNENAEGGYKFVPALNLTQSVQLLSLLEAESGYRIRYFAADGRMMPFDIPYDIGGGFTPQYAYPEDQGNILRAPVILTRRDPASYVDNVFRIQLTDSLGAATGQVDMTETRYAEAQKDRSFRGAPIGYKYTYYEPFFNSMFYRTFVGTTPETTDGTDGGAVLEAMNYAQAAAQAKATGAGYMPIGPAAGLEHFRLVWAQGDGFSRDIQGALRLTEYYRGALVEGQVLDAEGNPIGGATVVAFDDAGKILYDLLPEEFRSVELGGLTVNLTPEDLNVGHATTTADQNGRFRIRVPFSIPEDQGGLNGVTLAAYRTVGEETVRLGTTMFPVSREQANPARDDEVLRTDAVIRASPGTVTGQAFIDNNGNGNLETDQGDALVPGATFTVGGRDVTVGQDGNFTFAGTPNVYPIALESLPGGREVGDYEFASDTLSVPAGNSTQSLGIVLRSIAVNGTAVYTENATETNVADNTLMQFQVTGGVASNTARANFTRVTTNGTFALNLAPGTYNVTAVIGGATYAVAEPYVVPVTSEAGQQPLSPRFVLVRQS